MGALIIIPKDDKGGVRGVGLLKAFHKLIFAMINLRMNRMIEFCLTVHSFWCQRSCYMAIGKAKLRMKRAAYWGKPMYQIFFDLRKAYDSIHREVVLALLERYSVGPNIRRYVENIWEDQKFFHKQGGFF